MIKIVPLLDTLKLINLSDEEYFSSKYKHCVSNSRLSLINPSQDGSPEKYFSQEGMSEYSDSLFFGSLVHQMLLQPEEFYIVEDVNRPTAKMGLMADHLYPIICKEENVTDDDVIEASDKINYYKGKMSREKIDNVIEKCMEYWDGRRYSEQFNNYENKTPLYMDEKTRAKLHECINSVKKNRKIQNLLNPSYIVDKPISLNEQAVFLNVEIQLDEYEPIILELKAKLDNFTICTDTNVITLNDLKTSGKYLGDFNESWEKYHYYRQMGMYGWLLMLVAKEIYKMDSPILKANMLVVSTIPKYYSKVVEVSKAQLIRGFEEFKKLLQDVTFYTVNGYDGSVGTDI